MEQPSEPIFEPDLPIVDPHHHLWDRPASLLADLASGHRVRATVYLECGAMYRARGPEALRCVGETEFVNGVAAMTASGRYGDVRACAGIVGHADLRLGAAVEEVLRAHLAAAGGRFRGVRQSASWDGGPKVLGPLAGRVPARLYRDATFRDGFRAAAAPRSLVRHLAARAAAPRPHRSRAGLPRVRGGPRRALAARCQRAEWA